MQPSDARDEVEEDALTVPFGMKRHILIRHQFVAMKHREAVGIIGVALVRIRVPEKSRRHLPEDRTPLHYIRQRTAHTEVRVLRKHQTQMRKQTAFGC